MKNLLAVDLSYQVYRAASANPHLQSRRVFTGGLFGFLTTFAKAVRETEATDVVFCQDRKPYLRSTAYPEYKAKRRKPEDDEFLQMYRLSMTQVLDMLAVAGFAPVGVDGYESDDVIAALTLHYRSRFDLIYAASNDSDLWQMLKVPNFRVYTKGLAEVMDAEKLLLRQGLTPDQFMLMTALTGTHNDIEGIAGVGPVTAKRAINDPALMRKLREAHGALIDRNLGLIKLPYPGFPPGLRLPERPPEVDLRSMYRHLDKFDIDMTLQMENAFKQITS